MSRTILVVDDEPRIVELARDYLEHAGFRVITTNDGRAALDVARHHRPDLIVLDLDLPGLDGLDVTRELRRDGSLPIVMVTARDDELDKVLGLELGADDYITKPFSIREFRSRVRALLRRARQPHVPADEAEPRIEADGLVIDMSRRTVEVRGAPVTLTYVEFELLRTLAASPGRVFSRRMLLESLWKSADYRDPRTIDVHVRHLREKLEADPREPDLIHTVRGVGYRFRDA